MTGVWALGLQAPDLKWAKTNTLAIVDKHRLISRQRQKYPVHKKGPNRVIWACVKLNETLLFGLSSFYKTVT